MPGKRFFNNDYLLIPAILARFYFFYIAIFMLGRIVLLLYFGDRLTGDDDNRWLALLYGLRMDTITACVFLLFPALVLHFSPGGFFAGLSDRVLKLYFVLTVLLAVYMENATLPFINEYDVRPNIIFVNYLRYPKEVFQTIWATYKLELLVAFLMMAAVGWWLYRTTRDIFMPALEVAWWKRALLFVPVFIVLFAGIRSSFAHRPANPSDAVYSSNRLANEIALNTIHNVGYAIYSDIRHEGTSALYGSMPASDAISRVEKRLHIRSENEGLPFTRTEHSHFPTSRPRNLVILIEESLGAQFVEAVGGEAGITPELNELAGQGVLFRKLYSNGTRSVRGIAGLVSGFLAAPGQGVVKRNLSQRGFFTVAGLLKPYGYHTSFIYGGESRFDNMKSWFMGNGFDEIIDETDFDETAFHGTWGVSDEDLVTRADARFRQLHGQGQRFASVIFSTTNHTPFDFPPGRIELVDGVPEKSVKNAIKFADYAIGRFIELARAGGYYDDTVFVIAADHNVRVYGDDVLPVDMFRVPALILGGGVEPRLVDTLASQPDVLATALDRLGLDLSYPVLGHSIYDDRHDGVTLLQFHDKYGLRHGDEIAVISPGQKAETYRVTAADHLEASAHNEALEKDALAFVVSLDYLYKNRLFTLSPGEHGEPDQDR